MSATKMAKPRKTKNDKPESVTIEEAGKSLADFSAISLSFRWISTKKSLSTNEKAEAAQVFNADSKSLSASKKLFDTKNENFKQLTALRNQAYFYWRGKSLPYVDEGIRLFPKDCVEKVIKDLAEMREWIHAAEKELNADYESLLEDARSRLGSLFRESDYPASIVGCFDLQYNFHNVNPPDYLMQLNPQLYEEQKARMIAKFEQSAILAENMFIEEFEKLVKHLTDKLTGKEDGEQKIFHASSVDNLKEFFGKFKTLNLHSNSQLDKLVEQAQGLMEGVTAPALRNNESLRASLSGNLNAIGGKLDKMMESKPRRKIIREDGE